MAQTPSTRRAALLLLVLLVANVLLVLAEYPVAFHYRFRRVPPPDWITVLRIGVFAGQLFTLSLVGALAERRRWAMWLSALPFVLPLTLGFLPEADPNFWLVLDLPHEFNNGWYRGCRLLLIVLANSHAPLCMMLAGILLLSVICWPVKVLFGWRINGGECAEPRPHRVSTSQLILWVGLWSTLFFTYTQARQIYGTNWLAAAWITVPAVLIVGFPVAILCAAPQIRWYSWLAVVAYVPLLSYSECEMHHLTARLTPRGGAGIPLLYALCFNAAIATVVAANLIIMRAFGLRLHIPFRRSTKFASHDPGDKHRAPSRLPLNIPNDDNPFNAART